MHKHPRHIFFLILFLAGIAASAQNNEGLSDTLPPWQVHKLSEEEDAFLIPRPGQPIEEKKVPAQRIDSLKKEEAYWYANFEPAKKKTEQESSGKSLFDEGWFTTLLWVLIVVSFIAVVVWYLASSNLQLFRKEPERMLEEEEDPGMSEDIFMLNYDKEIGKAVEAKNYRLAVRLWYLHTLKELSERNIISYGHQKTNSDYLAGLWGGRYYHHFSRLTRNFEYTWYGGFNLSEEGYATMQQDFASFKNSLP